MVDRNIILDWQPFFLRKMWMAPWAGFSFSQTQEEDGDRFEGFY